MHNDLDLPTRTESVIQKVKTPFGSIFLIVEHLGPRILSIKHAQPQKFENTGIGELVECICEGISEAIKGI